jgi:hypothetical protein
MIFLSKNYFSKIRVTRETRVKKIIFPARRVTEKMSVSVCGRLRLYNALNVFVVSLCSMLSALCYYSV